MQSRVTTVESQAFGDWILSWALFCQRIKVSCTMSSASITVPNMRYAMENNRVLYSLNVPSASAAIIYLISFSNDPDRSKNNSVNWLKHSKVAVNYWFV